MGSAKDLTKKERWIFLSQQVFTEILNPRLLHLSTNMDSIHGTCRIGSNMIVPKKVKRAYSITESLIGGMLARFADLVKKKRLAYVSTMMKSIQTKIMNQTMAKIVHLWVATSLSHHWVLTYPEINSDQKYGAYSTPFCVFLQSLLRFIHTLEWTPKRYQSIASCIYVCIVLLILILAEYYILRIIIKLGRGVCVRYDTTDGSSILDTADAATATNYKSIVNCDLQYGRRFDIGTMHRTVFVQFQLRQYSEKVFFCLLLSFFLFYLVYFTLLYFIFSFSFRFLFPLIYIMIYS